MNMALPKIILAFDTALGGCGVAVLNTETGAVFSDLQPMTRGQSEMLVPMVDGLLQKAGIDYSQLDLIATTTGPGAFTGLRIGLSAARSFALALDIPVAGVTTTDVIARTFFHDNKGKDGKPLLVVMETKRTDLYFQMFSAQGEAAGNAGVISIDQLLVRFGDLAVTLCGDGVGRVRETLADNWPAQWVFADGYALPDPVFLARLGHEQAVAGRLQPADPLYLRDADVSVSTRPVRVIADKAAQD